MDNWNSTYSSHELITSAPPRTLADLRRAYHADVKKRMVAEVDKDLTNHPVSEIETHLLG